MERGLGRRVTRLTRPPARVCPDCRSWPCRCVIEGGTVTRPMEFSIRREPCACGGFIGPIGGNSDTVARAIRDHNNTPKHAHWRLANGIV